MERQLHWENVYAKKATDQVSWYRPHLELSLRFIENAGLDRNAAVIDVGGGASTLVDDLVSRGFTDVTVLDISATAVEQAKQRLGAAGARVHWIVGDITGVELPERRYAFWHDRAVFHFLADAELRRRYIDSASRALAPGGHIVVATFGPGGPERCSGLDVMRYSADGIHAEFGELFEKVAGETEIHTTPWGTAQEFVYCYCSYRGRTEQSKYNQ